MELDTREPRVTANELPFDVFVACTFVDHSPNPHFLPDPVGDAYSKAEARLAELARMRAGWLDGRGDRIDPDVVVFSLYALRALQASGMPVPRLYPTEDGGLRFEWSSKDVDVTADFEPDGVAYAQVVDAAGSFTDHEFKTINSAALIRLLRVANVEMSGAGF